MDDKTFKEKLSEVADWEIPKVSSGGNAKNPDTKKTGPKTYTLDEQQDEEVSDREYEIELNPDGTNPTVRPKLLKVKTEPKPCEDCGIICENRTVTIRKYINQNYGDHWRKSCNECKRAYNPVTKCYDLEGYQVIGDFFRRYHQRKSRG